MFRFGMTNDQRVRNGTASKVSELDVACAYAVRKPSNIVTCGER